MLPHPQFDVETDDLTLAGNTSSWYLAFAMAVHRPAPTNPLIIDRGITKTDRQTYSLPKTAKRAKTTPPLLKTYDPVSALKNDILRTVLVSVIILGIILLAVWKLK